MGANRNPRRNSKDDDEDGEDAERRTEELRRENEA